MHHQIIVTDAERIILGTERPAPSASEAIDPFFMNMNTFKKPIDGATTLDSVRPDPSRYAYIWMPLKVQISGFRGHVMGYAKNTLLPIRYRTWMGLVFLGVESTPSTS